MDEGKRILGDSISYASGSYDVLEGADALILVTEWNEFRRPDFERIKNVLKKPVIFDGRNQYDPGRMHRNGFDYICVGKTTKKALVEA